MNCPHQFLFCLKIAMDIGCEESSGYKGRPWELGSKCRENIEETYTSTFFTIYLDICKWNSNNVNMHQGECSQIHFNYIYY